MKYVLMTVHNDDVWAGLSQAEKEATWRDGGAWWDTLAGSGEGIFGAPFADVSETHLVRTQDGTTVTTKGPLTDSKDQIAGYVLLDVASEQRALELAAEWPESRHATIVVRQLMG
ncbi:MAG TPA: YciI family protein [Thermomicrobiales bacterium]|nr:YciI family protein [Thermomicrobiales bacterium]